MTARRHVRRARGDAGAAVGEGLGILPSRPGIGAAWGSLRAGGGQLGVDVGAGRARGVALQLWSNHALPGSMSDRPRQRSRIERTTHERISEGRPEAPCFGG